MFSSLRKLLLISLLFLFLVSLPTSVQSQEPTPHTHGFFERYIAEQSIAPFASGGADARSVAASPGLAHWFTERIVDSGSASTDLLIDSNDVPHIVFQYRLNDYDATLKYGYYDGTNWQFHTVDTKRYLTNYFSFDVDKMGHVHISYCIFVPGMACDDLRYAHYDGVSWKYEVVDDSGLVGQFSSIQADDRGYPHISYIDSTNYALKYAHYDGFTWYIETVDDSAIGATSLALDSEGHAHIAWIAPEGTKYAYNDGAGWQG